LNNVGLKRDEKVIESLKIQRSQTQKGPQLGQLDEIEASPRVNISRKQKKFKRKQKIPDLRIDL